MLHHLESGEKMVRNPVEQTIVKARYHVCMHYHICGFPIKNGDGNMPRDTCVASGSSCL